jgi:hypothetical protein
MTKFIGEEGAMKRDLGGLGNTLVRLVALGLLGISLLLRSRVFLFGSSGGGADFGLSDKNGTRLNRESACFDVAHHFGAGFDFHTIGADDVTMNFSVNNDGLGLYFGFDVGVFSNSESAIRANFSFDSSIDEKIVGEADGSIDVNVIAENITLSAGGLCGWA